MDVSLQGFYNIKNFQKLKNTIFSLSLYCYLSQPAVASENTAREKDTLYMGGLSGTKSIKNTGFFQPAVFFLAKEIRKQTINW